MLLLRVSPRTGIKKTNKQTDDGRVGNLHQLAGASLRSEYVPEMIAWARTVACPPHACLGTPTFEQRASTVRKRHFSSCHASSFSILCTATKPEAFIEEKLTDALAKKAGSVRQIVLLTDGEDHIPCRLQWPPWTVIFQISSCPVIKSSEVPKSSLLRYVNEQSAESEGWADRLRNTGYQGSKPSVWVLQGIMLEAETKLRIILAHVSSLTMQGSHLIGALNTTGGFDEDVAKELLEKILLGCGFQQRSMVFTTTAGRMAACILFTAEQLRLSDDQIDYAVKKMELAEESGDEETFEDWL